MIAGEQSFDLKLIDESNGDMLFYIPPQMVSALKYTRVINRTGNLVVTLPFNIELWNLAEVDRLIEASFLDQTTMLLAKDDTYLIRKKERYYEGDLEQMAFSCVGLLDLLARRVVKPTTSDDTSAGGFVTRAGPAGDVIGEFVDEQIINPDDTSRTFANITYQKLDDGRSVGVRVRYDNLATVLEQIRVSGEIDIEAVRVSDNDLQIRAGLIGQDYSYATNFPGSFMLVSPNLGNAINSSYSKSDEKSSNFVYSLGDGEGVNQYVLPLAGLGISASPYARIELASESKKGEGNFTSMAEQTYASGIQSLNSSKTIEEFDFSFLESNRSHVYKTDWDIGDYLTFFWTEAITFRISSVTVSIQGATYSRSVKLELPDE